MDPRVSQLPANRCKPREKAILCPFRCTHKDVNPHGYCKHLVGFTEDGRTIEMRELVGTRERCGHLTDEVKASDVIVPMATTTSRVYRKDGNAPFDPSQVAPPAMVKTK